MTTTDTAAAAAAAIEAAYSLFGFIFEAKDLIEFRTIGGEGVVCDWVTQERASRVLTRLSATVSKGMQVYYGANPRSNRGGKAGDVALARCLVADFDGGTTVEQAAMRWREASIPEPTVIVRTGGGVHAYWRLSEPMTDLGLWSGYQKALALRLGSDSSICDAPRLLRVPGFRNWKYPEEPLCVVHEAEPDHIWSLEEFPAPLEASRPLEGSRVGVEPGSLSDLSRRFLEDGFLMRKGRRTTVFTVACDMKARAWPIADAMSRIMSRAGMLGLSADELADLPRQVENAYLAERQPCEGAAEAAEAAGVGLEGPPSRRIVPVPICSLVAQHPQMRRPILKGLLRAGETLNLISNPKMGKSFLVNQLALNVSQGKPWMGFELEKAGRVLIVDNELHPETSADRIPKMAAALGYAMEDLAGQLEVVNLRGELLDFHELDRELFAHRSAGEFDLVILDAFYRFLPAKMDENDNGSMARIYNLIDRWARMLDCAFVLVHHASKGQQGEKAVTDVGSGAGSMSRAADTHLILRQHKEADHVVLDARVRSWAPIEPRVLRWSYPTFTLAPYANAEDLAKPGRREADEDGWTAQRFVEECFTVETPGSDDWEERQTLPWAAVLSCAVERHGLSKGRAETLRALAQGKGLIRQDGKGRGIVWTRVPEKSDAGKVNNTNGADAVPDSGSNK